MLRSHRVLTVAQDRPPERITATMNFQRFIRKHIPGLRVLNLSLESYLPGSVLHPKTLRRLGHVRDLLSGNDAEWETQLSQASMVYGQIEHSRKARAGISILGILKIGGGGGSSISIRSPSLTIVLGRDSAWPLTRTLSSLISRFA